MTNGRVAVVGLGLIGGSVALALRDSGVFTCGFDARPEVIAMAQRMGLVDEIAPTLVETVKDVEMVVLAAPVGAIVAMLPGVDAAAPSDAMIIDTGSVKAAVVAAMELLPGARRAIGGHPLAGKEQAGPTAADPKLFAGRPFAIVPSNRTDPEIYLQAEDLVTKLGALPIQIDAERHDHVLAYTSHLPQLLSTALALTVDGKDTDLAGPALPDMTRLARSDPALWRDILMANRRDVSEAARVYGAALQEVVVLLERDAGDGVEDLLRRGRVSALALVDEVQP